VIERLLTERATKGTSLAALSARSGIPTGTLSYWSWRLRRELRTHASATSSFVELVAAPSHGERPADRDGMLEVELHGGCLIRVGAGFDPEHLRRVIAALET
jgi:hypothetical protein